MLGGPSQGNAMSVVSGSNTSKDWSKHIDDIFKEVPRVNGNAESRVQLSRRLKQYVASQLQKLKGEIFVNLMGDLNAHITELGKSSNIHDNLTAVATIDQLLEIEYDMYDGDAPFVLPWVSCLCSILHQSDNLSVVQSVSASLACFARLYQDNTLGRGKIKFEIEAALEGLDGSASPSKKQNSVLFLAEIVQVPSVMAVKFIDTFLERMWGPLFDTSIIVRQGIVDVFKSIIKSVPNKIPDIYQKVIRIIQSNKSSTDTVHGSILLLIELFTSTEYSNMTKNTDECCQAILSLKEHKSSLIRKTVIQSIPHLVSFNKELFVSKYLSATTNYLVSTIKKERGVALITIGELTVALSTDMLPVIDSVFDAIFTIFKTKPKPRMSLPPELYKCLSLLALGVGIHSVAHFQSITTSLFTTEFCSPLIETLSDIAKHIPDMKTTIHRRLLDSIKIHLNTNEVLVISNATLKEGYEYASPFFTLRSLPTDEVDREAMVLLSLQTLGTFEFDPSSTRMLLSQLIVPYLCYEKFSIRKVAVQACCKILCDTKKPLPLRGYISEIVVVTLKRLFHVAMTDPDDNIRLTVLNSFEEPLDLFLAQPDFVRQLMLFLNDELYDIQAVSINILGRLSRLNPALIYPVLRNTLIKQITTLDFANDLSQREKAIRLFGLVVRSVPKLLRPYMEPIINSLMKKLTTTDTDEVLLQAYCLQALGDMSSVSGDYMIAHLDELLPLVLESFQDQQSSQKRLIALQTLGDLIENTGYAIEPFVRYPKLLETILQKMRRAGSPTLLCQLIKLIGIIGAIDPYRHKMLQLELLELDGQAEKSGHRTSFHKEFIRGISQQSEDYYPSITLHLLLRILKNPRSNSVTYLTLVIQIVVTIFKSIGVRCVGYLKHFIVPFIDVMNAFGDGNNLREFVLTQLKGLVSIIQHHTRDHLPHLMRIMTDYWYHENLQEPIILLLQEISNVLGDEFLPCLNTFLPKMLAVLSSKSKHSVVVLNTLKDFGSLLDPYIPLLIPEILKLFDNTNTQDVSINALRTIGLLSYNHDLQPYVISIFHHLQETIDSNITKDQKILEQSLKTVCDLLVNTGPLSYTYIGLFTPLLSKRQISFPQYSDIVAKIQRHEEIIPEIPKEYLETTYNKDDPNVPPKAGKTNVKILSTAWSTTDCVSDTSWQEWFRRISVTLLENSPSPALRCCAWLNYHNTGFRELFNPAFLSCWETINEDLKGEIIKSIRFTISPESTTPSEVLHSILDLAEFMDRSEKPLTIPIKDVAYLSEKCQAFAKALYYWEKLFRETKPTEDILDHLISMSDKLGQHDAANGLHKLAKTMNLNVDISWLEKLQQWINVLNQYDQIYKHNPDKKILLGRMRCLFNLGAWKELEEVSELALIDSTDKAVSYEIAEFAVKADFYLGNWTNLERHLACLDKYSADRAFYRAVVAISEDDYETCRKSIFHCRELVSNKLTTLMGESYSRAYSDMVRIQQLSELEEIITYKQTLEPEKKLTIQKLWKNRLLGMEKSVDVWQNVLALRTLVLPPNEDPITWVKFANLVKKNRRYRRSLRIMCSLLGIDINEQHPVKLPAETNPNVRYAYLKLLYEMGDRDSSYQHMMEWASTFRYSDVENTKQAQVYVTLTHWNLIKHEHNLNQKQIQIMINTCAAATSNHEEWHKAWHSWAILNYTVLRYYAKQQEDHPEISKFLLPSVNGFIQSIKFSPEENLQDNLRLLSLWFNYGNQSEVENAILEGIDMINIDTWLSAIPQIIARIQNPNIKNGIQHLLQVLGAKHPQALVFPIAVARKSPNRARQLAAQTVLNNMRQHSPKLVAEAQLVGDELIRTAILWNEKWFKALEEASQFYYVERRVDKMLAVLKPLHSLIKKGAHTANEKAFASVFEKDLGKAWENCKEFKKTRKEQCINIAWDVYAHVYRLIKKKLQTDFDKLHLSQISPALHQQTNYDLTVPGTYNKHYKANKPIVQIKSFVPIFKVIPSKQKPRKLVICGSDGNEYPFLLKGHEDLRQDERVMQLFGLVNTLLENDNITSKHHLKIQGYSVIPLSSESGLIEWLPHSDTLHELLSIYRKNHDIPLESELTCMQKFVQKNEYYILPAINKLEIFEYALEQTPGNDLQQIIWLNSKSSEQWLDRRTVYTRSLATMSMVGYILGLGDRHPNNLMLNRNSGQIIHIDFGDCFEIAQLREKFAEKVPFRLTRMLVNAMEVTGIEGTFAITCEEIMRVLRQNKESIKAVLEAFVYDPLLSWRFVCQTTGPREENEIEFAQILAKTAVREVDSIGGLYDSPKANKPTKIKKDWEDDEFTKDQGLEVNAKALRILERIDDKLSGRDFPKQAEELEVGEQVDLLLKRATDVELLSQAYLGWCPYW